MSSQLFRFRQRYPLGSLCCDFLQVDRGLYLVQARVTVDGIVLATALAAQPTLEGAEDLARERAIALLDLNPPADVEKGELPQVMPSPSTLTPSVSKSASPPPPVSTAPQSPAIPEPLPVTPPSSPVVSPSPAPVAPEPKIAPPAPIAEPVIAQPVVPPSPDPSLPWSFEPDIQTEPEPALPLGDRPTHHQNGSQLPLPTDVQSLTPLTPAETTSPVLPLLVLETVSTPILPVEPVAKQENLPASPPAPDQPTALPDSLEDPIDFSEIIARSNLELKRLGWTSEQGRTYLLQTYGKHSRQLLSDEQLIEFLAYLEQQPTPEP